LADVEDLSKQMSRPSLDFPDELKEYYTRIQVPGTFEFEGGNGIKWIHPSSLTELIQLKDSYPTAKIINGNTEIGIEVRFKNQKYPYLIQANDIVELLFIKELENGFELGAGVTLTALQNFLTALADRVSECKKRGIRSILENIKYFAGRQIRNGSSISGNICTASPISDLNPVWVALVNVMFCNFRIQSLTCNH
jgi:xanthine dehydrogenase/oxidase